MTIALVAIAAGALWLLTRPGPGNGPVRAPQVFARPQPRPAPSEQAQLTIDRSPASVLPIPGSFLGFSTEYWTLPNWQRQLALLEQVLSLVHVPGDGPFILRIGGDSADQSFWQASRPGMPDWAFALTPTWLSQTGKLIREAHLRTILDLNLVTATPRIAAQWAAAAVSSLPAHSIVGFEIGNEPDTYSRVDWLAALKGAAEARRILPLRISATTYARTFRAYARATAPIDPGIPLLGPALALPRWNVGWVRTLLRSPHPRLTTITAHNYPYSACAFPGTPAYPTIARILSERATAGVARAVRPAVVLAHRAGMQFRLSELNSVTCGGRAGVSDSFATALWAPDALFELLRARVDAVNVHVRAYTINAAFALTKQALTARPLLYGLIAFSRMLAAHSQLLHVHLRAAAANRLKAWAVLDGPDTLRLMVIDKGPFPASVLLRLPSRQPATVQRLIAPSAASRSGVTLAGQWLDGSGHWRGTPEREVLAPGPNGYTLAMPGQSTAIVELTLSRRPRSVRIDRRAARAVRLACVAGACAKLRKHALGGRLT